MALVAKLAINIPARPELKPLCSRLQVEDDPKRFFNVPFESKPFTLGRDLKCAQPLIGNSSISRHHCTLRSALTDNNRTFSVFLKDSSKNGTYINGARVESKKYVALEDECVVSFGDAAGSAFKFVKYTPRSLQAQYCMGDTELGRGTFGSVVVAHKRSTGVPVAVKMVKLGNCDDAVEERKRRRTLIKREVRIMGSIKHENVVHLENAIIEDDTVYIVMELAPFGTLGGLIRETKGLSEWDSKVITKQLCKALSYLHKQSIVHRDVKPANILIHSFDPPVIKVSDFGLAKAHDARSPTQTLCGTPHFMAPEVCLSDSHVRRYDNKVDSWSVGVTAFAMLAERLPFRKHDMDLEKGIDNRIFVWDIFPGPCSIDSRDLITKLCIHDPCERTSVSAALDHVWLTSF